MSAVRLAICYAREQGLIRSEFTAEDLFADFTQYVGA